MKSARSRFPVEGPKPWASVVAVIAAVVVFFWPAAVRALEYDRALILAGGWWRLYTGNWVHFSRTELFWNAAVLLITGIWAERLVPVRFRVLLLVAPTLIGGVLFLAEPELGRFAGLSGVAAGSVAFLALAHLRLMETDRWFWRAVLALVALKIAAEAIVASRWFAHYPDPEVRSVALIHLAGVAAAVGVLSAQRRRRG